MNISIMNTVCGGIISIVLLNELKSIFIFNLCMKQNVNNVYHKQLLFSYLHDSREWTFSSSMLQKDDEFACISSNLAKQFSRNFKTS